jgi:tight adherence protein B
MLLVIVLVFLGVFAVAALLLVASGTGASQQTKRTLTVLDAALSAEKQGVASDPVVDVRKKELLSAVPLLNRFLLKMEMAPRLRHLLYQANVKWTAGGLILMSLAAFVIPFYLVYLKTDHLLLAFIIGLFLGLCPFGYVLFKRRRRFNQFEKLLPEALDLMVNAMRAGHSLNSSLDLVAHEIDDPIGTEFRICFEEQNYGLELSTAMYNLISRVPLHDMKMIVTAILIQKESGGNLAEVLDKVAYVIRERFQLRRQVRTHTAQGRMTGWVLTMLPVILGFLLYLINPKDMSLLWTSAAGIKLLYAAGVMTIIGGLIIRKIVNMEV